MIVHFIEATQKDIEINHGKFMLGRFTRDEALTASALPDFQMHSLWTLGGLRRMRPGVTLVVDLQTGEGAGFSLNPMGNAPPFEAHCQLEKHKINVCPMFEPFLGWLYAQDLDDGRGDITALPRYIEIETLEGGLAGYRRGGAQEDDGNSQTRKGPNAA